MTSPARVWLTVGPVALAAGVGALALVLASEHEEQQLLTSIFGLLIGWSFLAAGLIARTRRPENRTGVLLLVVGFSFFVGALAESNWSLLFSVGFALGAIFIAALMHLLLAYPSGRLASRWERVVVVLSYTVALLANLVPFLFDRTPNENCEECPPNAFLIVENDTAHDVASVVFETAGFVLVILVAVTLFRRWRTSSTAARHLLGPVLLAGGGALFLFGIGLAVHPLSSLAGNLISLGAAIGLMTVPFVFLWGILRSRLGRADVGGLLDAPETPTLAETQDAVRELLRDPTLELLYWVDDPGAYFDVAGRKRELPTGDADKAGTKIDSEDTPLAALIHDSALLDEPERMASVTAALRLRLEKDRSVRELRISEYRSRALVEAIPDTIFRLARDGTFLDVQAHDPENLILPPEQMIGSNTYDIPPEIIAPETLSERRALVDRAFETGEVQSQEYDLNTHFGHRIAEARIVPSGDDEFVMIVRDITDERLTESRSRALVEALPDHMFRLTRDGRYLDFRPHDAERYGIDTESFLGTSIHDALPSAVAERVMAAAEHAFETGEVQTVEGEMEYGGKTIYAEARVVPSGHDEFVMIVRDVSERVAQQRHIESQKEFLEAIGDTTSGLLCNILPDGRIGEDSVNLPLRNLTGYAQGELDWRRFSEALVAPEDAPAAERAIAEVAAGRDPGEQESRWLTKDGRELIVAWTCTPLPAIEGEPRQLLISGTDVTERKQREDEQAALRRVAVAVASESRPEGVFQTVAEEVGRLLGGDNTHLVRFESEDEAIVLGGWVDGKMDEEVVGHRILLGTGPISRMRERGRTVRFDAGPSLDSQMRERMEAEGTASVLAAPVHVSGRLWGAVATAARDSVFPADAEERTAQFTGLVATAIANAEAREELHASRARIVEAGDSERRRLERNLHDGAQQRLVSLSLALRLAQSKLASDVHAADEILSSASVELGLALEELRELARGIHPAVLTDRGLGPALESLADRAPLPVHLEEVPAGRLPAPVEAAAFYVVSEALANVAKYAEASNVSVRIAQANGYAVVEVADDGVGGANPEAGTGLRGLSDRVAALEGRLAIVSPPGAGTRIRAEIPCG
jgi:PAS domain S-box-containing protein